ncbi:hypothetical protein C2G38_1603556 [Gigaspora rosea]|uniref:MACPF domain-containing protein n=1 Tax=Gigaspora rosea TaxID=44941 RepID=A0A397W708_9GLOM|nr:hypothetical protein C2G38_1603556 [Gigaspora rosea]
MRKLSNLIQMVLLNMLKKKAFKININKIGPPSDPICDRKDKLYKCSHIPSVNCKRSFIIDENFSAALEWFCNSLKLSRINSEQPSTMHMRQWRPKKEIIISDISATDEFIKDVKAALKNNEEDLVKQLRELSESYGHFYAERLILGGAIVKHKSCAKNAPFFLVHIIQIFLSLTVLLVGTKTNIHKV